MTFLKKLDEKYPKGDIIRIILDNHSAHTSKETQGYLNTIPGRFEFVFTPNQNHIEFMIRKFDKKYNLRIIIEID